MLRSLDPWAMATTLTPTAARAPKKAPATPRRWRMPSPTRERMEPAVAQLDRVEQAGGQLGLEGLVQRLARLRAVRLGHCEGDRHLAGALGDEDDGDLRFRHGLEHPRRATPGTPVIPEPVTSTRATPGR